MKAPSRYFTFEVDGKEVKCRLTMDAIKKLENNVGKGIQEYLEELGDDVIGGFIKILWASQQPFLETGDKFTLADSADMYDQLIEEDNDVVDISEIMQGILKESGLLPKDRTKSPDVPGEVENEDSAVEDNGDVLDPNE